VGVSGDLELTMVGVALTVKGINSIVSKLKKITTKEKWDAVIQETGKIAEKHAKKLSPYLTGELRRNIQYQKTGDFEFTLTNDTPYAIFNEYGASPWGRYGIIKELAPTGIGTPKAPKFYGSGYRPFMRAGVYRAVHEAHRIVGRRIVEGVMK